MRDIKMRHPEFAPIWKGRTSCFVRRVENAANVGDIVRIREFRDHDGPATGRTIKGIVKHRMEGNGIRDGFALLSLKIVAKHSPDLMIQSTTPENA
jgi:hypothetical protein